MSWTLQGWDTLPIRPSPVRVTYTQDSPGFRKGFKWTRKSHGDCMQLVFHANPSMVDLKVREIVHFRVDGVAQFTGIIVKHPGHQSQGAGPDDPDSMDEFIVYGLSYLLKEAIMTPEFSGDGGTLTNNISELVQYITQNVISDRVRYYASHIPLTGEVFSQFYMPYYPMNQVLDILAQAIPGTNYGVDQNGYFYFRQASTLRNSTSYSSQSIHVEWVPINAEEVVTGAALIVVTEASQAVESLISLHGVKVYTVISSVFTYYPYIPKPVVIDYEDPVHHPSYKAKITRLMGHLLRADSALLSSAVITGSGFNNPTNAYDDNPNTYAQAPAGDDFANASLFYKYTEADGNSAAGKRVVGCRIIYTSNHPTNAGALVTIMRSNASNFLGTHRQLYVATLPNTGSVSGEPKIVDIILPQATIFEPDASAIYMQCLIQTHRDDFRLYEFVPIYADTELGTEIAKSLIKLPAQNPSVISVANQLWPPTKTVYISDVPGIASGILEGDVAEYEYTVSSEDGKMTQVKFEQPDLSDETLIAKHMSQELDSQVIGQVRSIGKL